MIFAARRAWIEIDHIERLLMEDGYTRVERNDVMSGDIVLYRWNGEPAHVGLITAVEPFGAARNILVISKWGRDAEFIHHEENVAELMGKPSEYYTDRKSHEHVVL
jgi:hypothetical protein